MNEKQIGKMNKVVSSNLMSLLSGLDNYTDKELSLVRKALEVVYMEGLKAGLETVNDN